MGHLYTHANLRGNLEARLDAGSDKLDDEETETEFDEHEDSGKVIKVKSVLSPKARAKAGISEVGPRYWQES